ncbi:hypothetical protein ALC56_05502 [Trachymyrmex septentrionalis]|uniref:Protein takeout n=2 Tax=Trachymyrmex septentrionalis TaxID=34720 RepID=A0A151JY42_9HYME|nr:hypothetical protein ALC56_05502 [Trachymyrmex septentrionalis]
MPDLNILPIEPLNIKDLTIIHTDNLKVNMRDVKIYGFCDLVVNSVYTDPDRRHFNFDLNFNHLYLNGTYDFDVRILMEITHKGLSQITIDNAGLKVELDFKTITKNGNKYIYASKLSMNIDIKDFTYKIDESRKELADFYKIITDIINTNKKDIVKQVKPSIEKEISENIISILNNVFRRISYEELFPEKTRIV